MTQEEAIEKVVLKAIPSHCTTNDEEYYTAERVARYIITNPAEYGLARQSEVDQLKDGIKELQSGFVLELERKDRQIQTLCSLSDDYGMADANLKKENEALKAELDKHRWIPISERLPEEFSFNLSTNVISVDESGNRRIDFYDYSDKLWNSRCSITHWQPLPSPPTE